MNAERLKQLISESHERQADGEDYQKVSFDIYQEHELTDDEMIEIQSSPNPDCECGYCSTAQWEKWIYDFDPYEHRNE